MVSEDADSMYILRLHIEGENDPLILNAYERSCTVSYSQKCIIEGTLCSAIIIILHGLGRLISSGIDALSSFPGSSMILSSSRFVAEGMFRKSDAVHSFEMVDPVLFVFGFHVLYSRDL